VGIRTTVLIIGLLATALAWAGCGGGDSGGGEVTVSSISKGELIKKGDAICKRTSEEVGKDFKTFAAENASTTNPTEEQYSELIDTVLVSNVEQEIADIQALGVPKGDEEEIEAILAAREEGIEEAEAQPKRAVQANMAGFEEGDKLAKQYGFVTCAHR
jgi:hypothetical protein